MALFNISGWSADQTAEWLRGLDDVLLPYVHFFLNAGINGKKILSLTSQDLYRLNVHKVGHQELILEAVELLCNLNYGLEVENVQSIALHVACKARNLHNEIRARRAGHLAVMNGNTHHMQKALPLAVLIAVSDITSSIKSMVSWLKRSPFDNNQDYTRLRSLLCQHGIELITVSQQENYNMDRSEEEIMGHCLKLSEECEALIKHTKDPLIIQPASLELTTVRKKPDEELGMHIQSSYYGTHIIGGVKDQSPADLCGKVEEGDEVIQVNYQTVVGWQLKKLVRVLKENPKDVMLTLKKRPKHMSLSGQQPRKKKNKEKLIQSTFPKLIRLRSREGKEQPARSPIPDFLGPLQAEPTSPKDDTDNEVFRSGSESPTYRLDPPDSKQRRATVSGGSPTLKRPSITISDLTLVGRPHSNTISSPESEGRSYRSLTSQGSIVSSPESEGGISAGGVRSSVSDGGSEVKSPEFDEVVQTRDTRGLNSPSDPLKNFKRTTVAFGENRRDFSAIETPISTAALRRQAVTSPTDLTKELDLSESANSTPVSTPGSRRSDRLDSSSTTPSPKRGQLESPVATPHRRAESTSSISPSSTKSWVLDSPSSGNSLRKIEHIESPTSTPVLRRCSASDSPISTPLLRRTEAITSDPFQPDSPGQTPPFRRAELRKQSDVQVLDSPERSRRKASMEIAGFNKNEPHLLRITKRLSTKISDLEEPGERVLPTVEHCEMEKQEDEARDNFIGSYEVRIIGGRPHRILQSPGPGVKMRPKQVTTPRRLAVNRRISCKDLGHGDCQGWLWRKKEHHNLLTSKAWVKRWCVLKKLNFFYYKEPTDLKAEGVIFLPGFTVSPSPETKSKKYAFKVFHSGATFLFASERAEDMVKWQNKIGLSAIGYDATNTPTVAGFTKHELESNLVLEHAYYSESEDDDEDKDSSSGGKTSPGSSRSLSGQSSSTTISSSVEDIADVDTSTVPRRDKSLMKSTSGRGELTTWLKSIHQADLHVDGSNRNTNRFSTLVKADKLRINTRKSRDIDMGRKYCSLQRTLKDKERSLQAIDTLLASYISSDTLRRFKRDHPELSGKVKKRHESEV